jgi:L-fucose mutarotase/ribose pyranase (RbsD/FucU family)
MDCSEWGDEPESYERAKNAFVVVVTSEADGNVILKKGPVMI